MTESVNLKPYGIRAIRVRANLPTARLYELATTHENAVIAASGALATRSGAKTGRSPKDKRMVREPTSADDVWWGSVNVELCNQTFQMNRQRAIDFFNACKSVYVVDGYAGWDERYRLKVRVICTLAYHALFMRNMLIRPRAAELHEFEPDFVIYNAGAFPADAAAPGNSSTTSVTVHLGERQLVILGTLYAGEMKKGIFSVMNYLMPKQGILSMHCSANEGPAGDVSLFFGLSGTGKTTLSADPRRRLIGDDEHCWSDEGVFNIEGGCYAKCINLSAEQEPEIFGAIRFGTVLENVAICSRSREVDYADGSFTENTRAAYPIEFIGNVKVPCVAGHPKNIILLTCDAFGVLPPVSRLSPAQTMYHFLNGYTAKVAGTEVGVVEPKATFSPCFGGPFLVLHPARYATLLAEKMQRHGVRAWLVNTGWTGGGCGVGRRIPLDYTRKILDAIHSGALVDAPTAIQRHFGLETPAECPGIPRSLLVPSENWPDGSAYEAAAERLVQLFQTNFAKYAIEADERIYAAGPR